MYSKETCVGLFHKTLILVKELMYDDQKRLDLCTSVITDHGLGEKNFSPSTVHQRPAVGTGHMLLEGHTQELLHLLLENAAAVDVRI